MRDLAPGVLALVAAAAIPPSSVQASTPSRFWQNVKSLGVQCIVRREPFQNDPKLQRELCGLVAKLAARNSPVPVKVVQLGDPALIAPGAAALLVHASVQPSRAGQLLVFYVRPIGGPVQSTTLFGSAPRAVPLGRGGLASPAFEAELTAALAEVLPWQARQAREAAIPKQD